MPTAIIDDYYECLYLILFRGSDANTREEDLRRFASNLAAASAQSAPDEIPDGERQFDPDATLKLKRPTVPTVLRLATINGSAQLRHCTQLHERDADDNDNEVLDSSTLPTSVSPEEVIAAGVSRYLMYSSLVTALEFMLTSWRSLKN